MQSISVQDGLITLYDTHAHYTDSGAKLFSSISFSNCRFSPSQQLSAVSLCIKPESTAVNVHTTRLPLQLPTPPLNQQAAKNNKERCLSVVGSTICPSSPAASQLMTQTLRKQRSATAANNVKAINRHWAQSSYMQSPQAQATMTIWQPAMLLGLGTVWMNAANTLRTTMTIHPTIVHAASAAITH